MKKRLLSILLAVVMIVGLLPATAMAYGFSGEPTVSIQTYDALVPAETADKDKDAAVALALAELLVGDGVEIEEGTARLIYSNKAQVAAFTDSDGDPLGIGSGVMLSTGDTSFDFTGVPLNDDGSYIGVYDQADYDNIDIHYTDEPLAELIKQEDENSSYDIIYGGDTAMLEFQMYATGKTFNFEYAFASAEFNCDPVYNDIFGLFVKVNEGDFENIAKLPNGGNVTITNLRTDPDTNPSGDELEVDVELTYATTDMSTSKSNFNGYSNVFTAEKAVEIGDLVTIRFVIADVSDCSVDSAVFISGGSLNFNARSKNPLTAPDGSVELELAKALTNVVVKLDGKPLLQGTDYEVKIDTPASPTAPVIKFNSPEGLNFNSKITVEITLEGGEKQTVNVTNNIPAPGGEGGGATPPSELTKIDAVSVAFDWDDVADPEYPTDAVTLSPEHFQDKTAFWCYIDEEEGVMGLDYAEISGLPSDTMIYAQVGGLLESGYAFADVIATSCEEYEVVDYELDNYETDEYNVIFMLIEIGEASEVLALFGDNPPAENGPRAEIYIDPSTKDAFLGGDYIELGLRPNGAFGTEAAAPETFHPDGGWHERDGIGLRSNGSNKWSEGPPDDDEATADFFLPGIIDEGWLVGWSTEKDGSASAKGGAQAYGGKTATAVPGDSVEATTKTGKNGETIITAKTTAKVADTVDVVQTVEFDVTKKYFTTTVTLTNNGSDPVYDLSYIRAFDPDQRANDEFVDGDCTTDNYFYKDSDGNVWVMAFGNDNFNMGASYYPPYVPVEVSHDAMIEKAITPFVFCAAPSQDYTVQAVNTTFGWTLDYSSFYRDRNSGYLAGDALYGKHYFADGAIGLEFIVASLAAGVDVTFSWISSLDTDINTTIDNIEQEVENSGSDTPAPEDPSTPDPEIPSTPPTSSDIGSYTPPTVDVPMSNGENSVDVKVEVSGKDATIKPLNDKQIEQLVGDDNAAGDVVIDLTDMGKEIDTAGIPKKTLEAIVEAAEDVGNDTEHLVIKLTTAELKLDDAAMRAIVDQAKGDVIKFNFDDVGTARLNYKQKEAVKDMDVRKGYEAYITVNGVRISDFRGGNVEIIVPYTVPAGERVAGFSVWYIDDNGKIEKQKSTYDGKNKWFVVSHFSDYVIVYDENDANVAGCAKDETCPINAYTDVDEQAWYHDGVHYCIEEGLMNGVGSNLFAPNGITTRGQIVTILWRLEGQPLVEVAEGFNDVFESDWYNNAIRWASANKIVNGYGDTFGPNDAITREQMAAILWRYCKYKGIDVSVGEETNILSYEDAFDISSWAMEAMQWACGSGLIQGIEKNNTMYLDPQGNAVRSQSATMIYRFCTEIKK